MRNNEILNTKQTIESKKIEQFTWICQYQSTSGIPQVPQTTQLSNKQLTNTYKFPD